MCDNIYYDKLFKKFMLLLLVIGGLVWGIIGVSKFNLVNWIARKTIISIEPLIYILVGISALYYLFSRDFYLPFLGETVFPCEPLAEKIPDNADIRQIINIQPNTNVVFWASESSTEDVVDNPWTAYGQNKNSGVTRSDDNGHAVLRVRSPTSYKIPTGRVLKPHIHYRVCKNNGFLGRVETIYV